MVSDLGSHWNLALDRTLSKLSFFLRAKPIFGSEVATVQQFSFSKNPESVQT